MSVQHTGDERQDRITEPSLTRLVSLVTTLCDAYPLGLTRAEIQERIPEYGEGSAGPAALRQRFNRDKQVLGTLGLPLRPAPHRAADPEQAGTDAEARAASELGDHDYRYVVDPTDFARREIRLTAEESLALQRAVELWAGTGLHETAAAALEGIAGLYERRGELLETVEPPVRRAPVSAYRLGDLRDFTHLTRIAEATRGDPVIFEYAKQGAAAAETRRGLVLGCGRRGRWYLVVHDLDRDQPRTYRLDRIVGRGIRSIPTGRLSSQERELAQAVAKGHPGVGADGRTVDPSRLDIESHLGRGLSQAPISMTVELAEGVAQPLLPLAWSAEPAQRGEPSEEGRVQLHLHRPLDGELIADLAAAADSLRVYGSAELKERLREHLGAVVRAGEQVPEAPRLSTFRRGAPREEPKAGELRRLLDIVAHLHSRDGATRGELCTHFGRTPEQLHTDLWHIQVSASWTGGQDSYIELNPFIPHDLQEYHETIGPETLIQVEVPLSREAFREEFITRPLLLTKPAALSVRLALDGLIASAELYDRVLTEAAKSLREKLRAMLPEELHMSQSSLTVDWQVADRYGWRQQILQAVEDAHPLRITYRPASGDPGERTVEPVELVYSEDAAYLRAWCRRRRGERWFRLDRITTLEPLTSESLGEQARRLAAQPSGPPEVPQEDQQVQAVLHFAPPAAGEADRYAPLRHAEHPDGSRTVLTAMRSAELVVDLCLRSGGDVAVVEPRTLREEVLRRARCGLQSLGVGPQADV